MGGESGEDCETSNKRVESGEDEQRMREEAGSGGGREAAEPDGDGLALLCGLPNHKGESTRIGAFA